MADEERYGLLDRLDSLVHRRLLPVRTYPDWETAEKVARKQEFRRSRPTAASYSIEDWMISSPPIIKADIQRT